MISFHFDHLLKMCLILLIRDYRYCTFQINMQKETNFDKQQKKIMSLFIYFYFLNRMIFSVIASMRKKFKEEEKVTLSTFPTFPRPGVLPRTKSGCRRWSMQTFIVGAREHLVTQPAAAKKRRRKISNHSLLTAYKAVTSQPHTELLHISVG